MSCAERCTSWVGQPRSSSRPRCFSPRSSTQTEVTSFIDDHRGRFGVEPICRTLDVSASAYYHRASGQRSDRVVEDELLLKRIEAVHADKCCAYRYRRTWNALLRAGEPVGRDLAKRLMRAAGIQGAKRRGRRWRTTTPDPAAMRPPDLVDREFTANGPDELWVAEFTFLHLTFLRYWEGVVFFSFALDVFSRHVVGWQFARHMRTDLVLEAMRMALTRRQAGPISGWSITAAPARNTRPTTSRPCTTVRCFRANASWPLPPTCGKTGTSARHVTSPPVATTHQPSGFNLLLPVVALGAQRVLCRY